MKIISNETGETIANILTNHSMTLDEALAVIIRYEVEIVVPEFNAVKDVIRVTRVFGFEGLCTYEVEGFVEGHAVVGKDVGNGFAGFITDDFHGFPP